MREHLYKARRVDNGDWVEGDLIRHYENQRRFIVCDQMAYDYMSCGVKRLVSERYHEVDPKTICQFIQEVNKYRIFESDIVKAYMHGDLESQPFTHPITFRNGTYWFGHFSWVEFLNVMRFVEVIGNVHDKEVVK